MRALDVFRIPALVALAMMTVSCAFFKKQPEETTDLQSGDQTPVTNVVSTTPASESQTPSAPTRPAPVIDDGLRLPDNLLALPSDRELRKPEAPPPAQDGGGVTARPPVSD